MNQAPPHRLPAFLRSLKNCINGNYVKPSRVVRRNPRPWTALTPLMVAHSRSPISLSDHLCHSLTGDARAANSISEFTAAATRAVVRLATEQIENLRRVYSDEALSSFESAFGKLLAERWPSLISGLARVDTGPPSISALTILTDAGLLFERISPIILNGADAGIIRLPLTDLRFTEGDIHEGFRTTVQIRDATGRRFFLKTRDAASLECMEILQASILAALQLDSPPSPTRYCLGGYHLVEDVTQLSGGLRDRVWEYAGVTAAAAHFLNMSDLHFQNVVPAAGSFYVIDTEAYLVQARPAAARRRSASAPDHDVLSTGLLPFSSTEYPSLARSDVYGFSLLGRSATPLIASGLEERSNRQSFLTGLDAAYGVIAARQEALVQLIAGAIKKAPDARCRIQIRPTFVYSRLIAWWSRLAGPSAHNERELKTLLSHGFGGPNLRDWAVSIVQHEMHCILSGYVPHFSVSARERFLETLSGQVLHRNFFATPPLEYFKARAQGFGKMTCSRNVRLVERVFSDRWP